MLNPSPKNQGDFFPSLYTRRSISPQDLKFARVKRLHDKREKYWKKLDTTIKQKHSITKCYAENNFNKGLLEFKENYKDYKVELIDIARYEKQKKRYIEDQYTKYQSFWKDLKIRGLVSIPRSTKNRSSIS